VLFPVLFPVKSNIMRFIKDGILFLLVAENNVTATVYTFDAEVFTDTRNRLE